MHPGMLFYLSIPEMHQWFFYKLCHKQKIKKFEFQELKTEVH
jgi:hypothetical protein